mgnify:CR=1 FL=1|tara:strand:- start:2715 stop:3014 length:300 start_codon:yes stop_codon:yes gene_type:complete
MYLVEIQQFGTSKVFKKPYYKNHLTKIMKKAKNDKVRRNIMFEMTEPVKNYRLNLLGTYSEDQKELAEDCYKSATKLSKGNVYLLNTKEEVDKILLPLL